ncbi:KdsC family phosphatase, partial [Haemophilus influenzae]
MNEIYQKAKHIKLFAMDVDGILSDGQIIYNSEGTETKAFYVQDGLGLQALKQSGIILAIITGRSSAMVDRRAKELGISHIIQGQDDKLTA